MIVMKFGGTSVKDAAALANVAKIVTDRVADKPLVVLSAGGGVTDALITISKKSISRNPADALADIEQLRIRHFDTAELLLDDKRAAEVQSVFSQQFEELETLVKGVSIIRELTPRIIDHFMSFGERWSCILFEQKLQQDGYNCTWIDSREVMVTDNDFTKAAPLFDLTENRVRQHIFPLLREKTIVVTQGFIGSTKDGITSTLGRGGSDYTAAIFGALLDAEEIQIWTDVSGVLTANPLIITNARPVRELSFNEAAELAYFGAKVLHPSTIIPAIKKKIPVRVLNSNRPSDEGTLITANGAHTSAPINLNGDQVVKSIAHRSGITVIRIQSTRMLMAHGFLAKVFEIFARYKKSVDVIATSEVGISLTVDDETGIEMIVKELQTIAEVYIAPQKAVVSIVGENMKHVPGMPGRIFTALGNAGIKVELISHGGSEINFTFIINESRLKDALLSLHNEFFGEKEKIEQTS